MSVETLAAVLHHSRARGAAKLVLIGIANHDGDGGAWPAVTTLAKYANVDVRSVQRALQKLVSLGELVIELQAGGDRDTPDHSRPNRYLVAVSCPPWCDRTHQHRDTRETRQARLSTGVTPVSPPQRVGGDASVTGGVTPVSPGGVTPVSPKPSLEPDTNQVSAQVQYARESCAECSARDELVCRERQRKLAPPDRHTYRPVVRRATG